MEKYEQLELVKILNENNTIRISFIDDLAEEIKEVNLHLDKYDKLKNSYVPNAEQYAKTLETLDEKFNVGLDNLDDALGQYHDVYEYDSFCSLWEINEIKKFTKEMKGDIYQVTITNIYDNGNAIIVRYDLNGDTYQSKLNYSTYLNKKWYVDKVKKNKQIKKFEEKFGVPLEESDELIGRTLMVEVKSYGQNYFGDMKKLQ